MIRPFPRPNLSLDQARLDEAIGPYRAHERARVAEAVAMASYWHRSQVRADQSPYITHLLRVAAYVALANEGCPTEWVEASILHDALEDTELPENEISDRLSPNTLSLVLHLTRRRRAGESSEERSLGKEEKLLSLRNAPQAARKIKVWDIADNVLSMRYIAPDADFYRKIPRWIAEAEEIQIPFSMEIDQHASNLMIQELHYLGSIGFAKGERVGF